MTGERARGAHGPGARALVFALSVALAGSGPGGWLVLGREGAGVDRAHAAAQCIRPPLPVVDDRRAADELLGDRYLLSPHPVARLPADPTWREDPFGNRNWLFQFHSLRYTWHLLTAFRTTGDRRYLDRFRALLRDWAADNARDAPPSPFSWDAHSTAWRGAMYACAASVLPAEPWLRNALELHGGVLAEPSFYEGTGNHALNQDQGLLALGCVLRRQAWIDLASRRMATLVRDTIDEQGAALEPAIEYQLYNLRQFRAAAERLRACGRRADAAFGRLDRMTGLLAHATVPNGEYELLGDTSRRDAARLDDATSYAATRGDRGAPPAETAKVYRHGYVFTRSGWGTERPFEDEIFLSLRFGRQGLFHAHADPGAVTLYGYGSRLIVDSGKYAYEGGVWREYFTGADAHNLVVPEGAPFRRKRAARLRLAQIGSDLEHYIVEHDAFRGIRSRRRVLFLREAGAVVVEDELSSISNVERTWRQLWHLREDARPVVEGEAVRTRRARGNVAIVQLIAGTRTSIVRGRTDPVQGWISYEYGERIPAPVVEAVAVGRTARYLTLLVPSERTARVSVEEVEIVPDGFALSVEIDGRAHRLEVAGSAAAVRALG